MFFVTYHLDYYGGDYEYEYRAYDDGDVVFSNKLKHLQCAFRRDGLRPPYMDSCGPSGR